MEMLMKALPILVRIRCVPSRAASFLVKLGWGKSPKSGRPAMVTVREGLTVYVESSFFRLTDVQVADDDTPGPIHGDHRYTLTVTQRHASRPGPQGVCRRAHELHGDRQRSHRHRHTGLTSRILNFLHNPCTSCTTTLKICHISHPVQLCHTVHPSASPFHFCCNAHILQLFARFDENRQNNLGGCRRYQQHTSNLRMPIMRLERSGHATKIRFL